MGQKVHPRSIRLGYIQDWQSRWFSLANMPAYIGEDFHIRNLIKDRFPLAAISWVGIERAGSFLRVNIHTARPGLVIGKRGVDIEALKKGIEKIVDSKVFVNVIEIKQPEVDAQLVAEAIAFQLEKRAHYASAIRRAIDRAMASKALGIKIMVSGRLGGNEIARTEWKMEGRVPLHTLCADIDYGFAEANTVSGKIGVKVWIDKKHYFAESPKEILSRLRKKGETKIGGEEQKIKSADAKDKVSEKPLEKVLEQPKAKVQKTKPVKKDKKESAAKLKSADLKSDKVISAEKSDKEDKEKES
ncbi:MAG TPA: 30S ribosomal protein S3 [Elusimicrobiales bacterium]|nr:30S ribosomal protein S3 [Elusimicrobiales bacterium]